MPFTDIPSRCLYISAAVDLEEFGPTIPDVNLDLELGLGGLLDAL